MVEAVARDQARDVRAVADVVVRVARARVGHGRGDHARAAVAGHLEVGVVAGDAGVDDRDAHAPARRAGPGAIDPRGAQEGPVHPLERLAQSGSDRSARTSGVAPAGGRIRRGAPTAASLSASESSGRRQSSSSPAQVDVLVVRELVRRSWSSSSRSTSSRCDLDSAAPFGDGVHAGARCEPLGVRVAQHSAEAVDRPGAAGEVTAAEPLDEPLPALAGERSSAPSGRCTRASRRPPRARRAQATANSRQRATVSATANRSRKTIVSSAMWDSFLLWKWIRQLSRLHLLGRPLALRPRLATGLPWSVWNELSTSMGPLERSDRTYADRTNVQAAPRPRSRRAGAPARRRGRAWRRRASSSRSARGCGRSPRRGRARFAASSPDRPCGEEAEDLALARGERLRAAVRDPSASSGVRRGSR